jgi:hypothetical protein
LRRLALAVLLYALAAMPASALDRNAFTFTRYDLHLSLDPHQHALAVEGTVELRNISKLPQREAVLQLSSSLQWLAIRASDGTALEWLAQTYTSDIDHTGLLNEAIVKSAAPIAPGATLTLQVRYSGTVQKDTSRLERIGTPADVAMRSDWDEISDNFTALRGAGFVVWYPVSMDAANLAQGNELFETLRNWRDREASAVLRLQLSPLPAPSDDNSKFNFVTNASETAEGAATTQVFRGVDPVIVLLSDAASVTDRPHVSAYFTAAHTEFARDYITAAESVIPPLELWFGSIRRKVVLVELTDPNALPYNLGSYYFVPMRNVQHAAAEVALARPVLHAMFDSPRPWVSEGLAGFAQALVRERQAGRRAALDYLSQFRSALAVAEAQSHSPVTSSEDTSGYSTSAAPPTAPAPPGIGLQPLVTTSDEIFLRTKAAYVWWMLRDIAGDRALQSALSRYRPAEDRDTGYVQRLLEERLSPKRDLEPFFDDWVYRDRGLPRFQADSAFVRTTLGGETITAVTVENLSDVWCEIPVSVRSATSESVQRLALPANGKATVRVPFGPNPKEAVINDGSVPESDPGVHILPATSTPPSEP